ncbi:MAG: mechanosensitive ion channel family protein [Acidobacteriota bacterium]
MKRGSRLIVPLLFAVALGALHWILVQNAAVLQRRGIDAELAGSLTRFLLDVALIFFVVRLLDLLLFDLFSRRRQVQAPALLREIVSIGLFIVLLVWAVSSIWGTGFTAVLATGTVVAAVLGLAMQETLGNLFAGIALHLDDSFKVGDVVRTGDHLGVVEAVRWRGTRLRTFTNSVVIVPNSLLARERVEVFPRNNLNARVLSISLDYNVAPSAVLPILTQAASNVDGVSTQVPAYARVGGFGDSGLTYEIKYHTLDYSQRDRIDADIRKAAWYALRRNEIPIAFPVRLHQRYEVPLQRKELDATQIAGRLARIDVLSPLSVPEHESIASMARVHAFSKGETIIREGQSGDSMFAVHEGVVAVRIGTEEVARLGAGDFFGEMALLTGENRAADVVALSDVLVIEITKAALQPVLQQHPGLVEAISSKVTERRGSIESLRNASTEEAQQTVLSRIRSYFGL